MPNDKFLAKLRELGVLYSKTKKFILRAEQVDPQSRSNIAIFKEQRDALDHVMRALWEYFEKGPNADETYLCAQIDNARGHMFRAAFDALDGAGISYKFRIDKAMAAYSNDAIIAVYPEYFTHHVIEVNNLDQKIVEHRKAKDERRTNMDDLDAYCASVERLDQLSNIVIEKIPAFQDWQNRHKKHVRLMTIAVGVALVLLAVGLDFLKDLYWRRTSVPAAGPAPSATVAATPTATP